MTGIWGSKREMRKYFKGLRDSMSLKSACASGLSVCRQLMEDPKASAAGSLLLYYAVGNEVDLMPFARWAMEQGKIIAYPRCAQKEMDFFAITDFSQLSRQGSFLIPEPEGDVPFVPDEDTVMIAPGVAFSMEGARLGMGGGYYDRYLARYPKLYAIGVCHNLQLTKDWVMDPYDRRVAKVYVGI